MSTMIMELTLTLDFTCRTCELPVSATVHCKGKGLSSDQSETVAEVSIPCPDCHAVNLVYFKPTGEIHDVRLHPMARTRFEPSIN